MADTVPLTYRELAERLGVSNDAARMKAKRLKWQRLPPNHPSEPVRVLVPLAALEGDRLSERSGGDRRRNVPSNEASLVRALEAHIETLKEDIAGLKADLERERAECERERTERQAAIERSNESERLLREAEAARARLTVENERLRRPWWRRRRK